MQASARQKLLKLLLLFVSILLVAFWILWVVLLSGIAATVDARIDFFAFWGGASLAIDGEAAAAYDDVRMTEKQLSLPGTFYGVFKWLYPPTFFLFLLPIGLLPMTVGLSAWVLSTAALMFSALRRMTREWPIFALAFLFPATYFNFLIGQNGMLTAGLFAWGCLLLRDRPVLAGSLLGLLTYKPQFFPLVLLALIVSRQKQAATAALASATAIALLSLVLFGMESWQAFYEAATGTGGDIYSSSPFVHLDKMQSISATLRLAGAPAVLSQVAQILVGLLSAGAVVWLWRSRTADEYRWAGLSLSILLATPYVYHYDLTLMGFALLWMLLGLRKSGSLRTWHCLVFAAAWSLPLSGPLVARYTDFVPGPFVIAALLFIVLAEVRAPQASTASDAGRESAAISAMKLPA